MHAAGFGIVNVKLNRDDTNVVDGHCVGAYLQASIISDREFHIRWL